MEGCCHLHNIPITPNELEWNSVSRSWGRPPHTQLKQKKSSTRWDVIMNIGQDIGIINHIKINLTKLYIVHR